MNLAHLLARAARTDPARLAIFSGATPVASYGEWQDRAARLAGAFHEAGLAPGERVVLFQRNHPRYLEVLLGAWWAGLVVVPVNAKLHPGEAQWIIDNAQARWAFVTSDVAPSQFEALERQVDIETPAYEQLLEAGPVSMVHRAPDDIAWLFYTSGTTGRPKGVMLTHRNLMTMGLTYFVDVDPITSQDAIVYAAPMSHGAGIYAIPHLMAGARHIVPASGGVEPAELFGLAKAAGPLSMFAAPTIVKRLVDHAEAHGESSEGFKTIVYGGAPMYAADIERALRVMGPRFVQIYGQGETPMVGTALARAHLADTMHPRHAARIASVGVAQTPVQVRVADGAGHDLPVGEVGEVLVRGDTVMAGYWRNPRGHCGRHPRRLALDRRHGGTGRRRFPDAEGPQQGPDHQRRLQHLPARSRGSPADRSRGGRSGGGGRARPGMGRDGGGLRGAADRDHAGGFCTGRPLSVADCPLQAPETL
jgi:long-chain acyl-CoA synthetase